MDSIIIIFIPPLVIRAEDVAHGLIEVAGGVPDKTVIACFLGTQGLHDELAAGRTVIPSYAFPESAALALAKAERYAAWKTRPAGTLPEFPDIDRASAAQRRRT